MEQMGAPADVLEQARAQLLPSDFELLEECEPSFRVFMAMQTQWRTRGMDGQVSGLDYNTMPFVMRMEKIPLPERPQVFQDVRLMEMETLKVVADRRAATEK